MAGEGGAGVVSKHQLSRIQPRHPKGPVSHGRKCKGTWVICDAVASPVSWGPFWECTYGNTPLFLPPNPPPTQPASTSCKSALRQTLC